MLVETFNEILLQEIAYFSRRTLHYYILCVFRPVFLSLFLLLFCFIITFSSQNNNFALHEIDYYNNKYKRIDNIRTCM